MNLVHNVVSSDNALVLALFCIHCSTYGRGDTQCIGECLDAAFQDTINEVITASYWILLDLLDTVSIKDTDTKERCASLHICAPINIF